MFAVSISKKKTKNIISSFLVLSIIISMASLTPTNAIDLVQQQNGPQGNNVSWQSQQNTTQDSWSWTSQGWQFGPIPTFTIFLENGTQVTDTNYIPLGQTFTTLIDVQKSIFVGNATLGQAGLQWMGALRSENGTITGNANLRMMYVNMMQYNNFDKTQQNNWETNTWHIDSSIINQTGNGNIGQPPQPKLASTNLTLNKVMLQKLSLVGEFKLLAFSTLPHQCNHIQLTCRLQTNTIIGLMLTLNLDKELLPQTVWLPWGNLALCMVALRIRGLSKN
jgi:hypothetical protein